MARDRKRAKQRRERRAREGVPLAPKPTQPVRADLPGALEHAGGEVDEFDAALVRGAGGVPLSGEPEAELAAPGEPAEAEPHAGESAVDDRLQEPAAAGAGGGDGRGGGAAVAAGDRERPSGAPLREGNRAAAFLRASWAELQRVQWPDRRHVTQATAVVLGFVAVAGAYLGLADYVAKEIVEFIL